jgi:hypothetical protein
LTLSSTLAFDYNKSTSLMAKLIILTNFCSSLLILLTFYLQLQAPGNILTF